MALNAWTCGRRKRCCGRWKSDLPKATIGVFAAAVADYRPAESAPAKIKRAQESLTIRLEPNPDILGGGGEE